MLNCAEQVQMQKYKPHAYKTPKTACVHTIILKIQLICKDGGKKGKKNIYVPIKCKNRIPVHISNPDHTNYSYELCLLKQKTINLTVVVKRKSTKSSLSLSVSVPRENPYRLLGVLLLRLRLCLGFVHPLQDVALHQCLPLSSVCCFPDPGGSLLLCHVVLPSSAWVVLLISSLSLAAILCSVWSLLT